MELVGGKITVKGSLKVKCRQLWAHCMHPGGPRRSPGDRLQLRNRSLWARFPACVISLGILHKILASGLNLDPINNLAFFVAKSRFNQTSSLPFPP